MRDVTGDWAPGVAHEHDVARVDYKVAVPKHRPSLARQNVGVACSAGSPEHKSMDMCMQRRSHQCQAEIDIRYDCGGLFMDSLTWMLAEGCEAGQH